MLAHFPAHPWSLLRPDGLEPLWLRAAVGLPMTLAFALLARRLRAVSRGGAAAGALVTFVVFLGAGAGGFAGVVTVFLLTSLATRAGYSRKLQLGTAEKREGRSARQVLANLTVAAAAAAAALLRQDPVFLLALAAALAEAAADTVSSELGQALEERAYLITTFAPVAAGTNGGISVAGTLAGGVTAFVVAGACAATYVIQPRWITVAAAAAVLGMMCDSVLGATAERPRGLNNDGVNFLSTLLAAGCGLLLGSLG